MLAFYDIQYNYFFYRAIIDVTFHKQQKYFRIDHLVNHFRKHSGVVYVENSVLCHGMFTLAVTAECSIIHRSEHLRQVSSL